MNFVRRVRTLPCKDQLNKELSDEIAFHLEKQIEQNVGAGMSAQEAHYMALRQFGRIEQVKEECRDMWGVRFIESTLQDIRFGLHILTKNPGLMASVVITLAFGIGLNTAIFTIVEAVALRSLPVRNPDRLVQLLQVFPDSRIPGFPYPYFEEFLRGNHVFTDICAFNYIGQADIVANRQPEVIDGLILTSSNYLQTLGVNPIIGRSFDEVTSSRERVALIGFDYWKRRFYGSRRVLGEVIEVNGVQLTIIGVLPQGFWGTEVGRTAEVLAPISLQPEITGTRSLLNDYLSYFVTLVGRLRPGITRAQAESDLRVLFQRAWDESTAAAPLDERAEVQQIHRMVRLEVVPATTGVTSGLRDTYLKPLMVLTIGAGVVLMITCINVAGLLSVRTAARHREIAIRLALGASRARIALQFLTESVVLAVLGGVSSMLVASWGSQSLIRLISSGPMHIFLSISPDLFVFGFTAIISLLSGVTCGLLPALHGTRADITSPLKDRGLGTSRGQSSALFGRLFVVSQVALSFVLLVGAGLLSRTLKNLESVRLGFDPQHVLLFSLNARPTGYRDRELMMYYEQIRERITLLPGVRTASFSLASPLSAGWGEEITLSGQDQNKPVVYREIESPGYFSAMGIPILLGRDFASGDNESGAKVAIVNESAARLFFPGEKPVGRRIGLGPGAQLDTQIVGIVGDAKYDRLRELVPQLVYTPALQASGGALEVTFEVKTQAEYPNLVNAVQREVQKVNNLPIYNVRTLSSQVARSLSRERLMVVLSTLFAALGLLLTCVGIYGAIAYGVKQRTHEIGIRAALGARRMNILWLVMREGLVLVALGVGLGVAGALASTRLLIHVLYGVQTSDPFIFVLSCAVLLLTAFVSSYIPAYKAALVDPIVALRHE